jgi:hypothetical protein
LKKTSPKSVKLETSQPKMTRNMDISWGWTLWLFLVRDLRDSLMTWNRLRDSYTNYKIQA